MTQSGQGEDAPLPPERHAHEGIVLPSDGGEPLLPGAPAERPVPPGGPERGAPAGGQAWGQPWGPQSPPPAAPGNAWGAESAAAESAPGYGSGSGPYEVDARYGTDGQGYALDQGSGRHQPDQYQQGRYPQDQYPQHRQQGGHQDQGHGQQSGGWGAPEAGHALPPAAAPGALPPAQPPGRYAAPEGQAYAPENSSYGPGSSSYGSGDPSYGPEGAQYAPGAPQYAPESPQFAPGAGQFGPEAGRYIPDEGPTQYIPPVAPGALPPEMPAGPAPHGTGSPHAESTRFLGSIPQQPDAGDPSPYGGAQPPAPNPDAEPTQYIAPVPAPPPGAPYGIRPGTPAEAAGQQQGAGQGPGHGAGPAHGAGQAPGGQNPGGQAPRPGQGPGAGQEPGERQPPAEFDSLFRTAPGEAPAATQQMPRYDARRARGVQFNAGAPAGPGAPGGGAPYPPPGGGEPGGRAERREQDERRRRTGSKVPLLAAVGVGIAVIGVGAGALLSSSGGDGDGDDKSAPVSATAPEESAEPSPSVDPVEEQAVALDKLLADSNNSRSAVISSVGHVKSCDKLGESARSLREAGRQRSGLVTRLGKLSVDKLPDHARLTAALTKAWQASASADNHYAAWADQVGKGGKKFCPKGKARGTSHTVAANRSSGEATKAKQEAAGLWNTIAEKYGLTARDKSEL
ncbi:hypothetical protein ABZ929_16010 [Streptomyces physcomitrii]|uniref:hypothetical protein n=1 Tax=Streptomyces physcomitrii TaxID=2724184 RepID=UPI00340D31A6